MSGFMLTLHFIDRGFEGEDSTNIGRFVFDHLMRHIDQQVVRMNVGEGIFEGRVHRGGGSRGDSELAYGTCGASKISSPEGFFPTVRATAVQRSVRSVACVRGLQRVLAGDLKMFNCTTMN